MWIDVIMGFLQYPWKFKIWIRKYGTKQKPNEKLNETIAKLKIADQKLGWRTTVEEQEKKIVDSNIAIVLNADKIDRNLFNLCWLCNGYSHQSSMHAFAFVSSKDNKRFVCMPSKQRKAK